jgi:hypothetical protein
MGDTVKQGTGVDEGAKSARLLKSSLSRDPQKRKRRKRLYLERLAFTHVVQDYGIFTHKELAKLTSMAPGEQNWRNSFFDSLIHDGLLGELQKLPTEELRQFVFMQKEEQEKWRSKLTQRKASHEPQTETHVKPESWPERLKSSAHYFEKKVSLQVPMHPEMREQVAALATSYGLGSGEFVEKMLAEQLAHDSKRVGEGRELIAQNQFKRPYRAKVQALRKEIEELRREKSPQRD